MAAAAALAATAQAGSFFDLVLKELNQRLEELNVGINSGAVPSRKDLEEVSWKIGRSLRLHIKPELGADRKTFWEEVKGYLKQVIIWEKFNAGKFSGECVSKAIIETDLVDSLSTLVSYTRRRKMGDKPAKKKAKVDDEDRETVVETWRQKWDAQWEAKGKGKGKEKGKKGKGKKGPKTDDDFFYGDSGDLGPAWDEIDSDPDEPCPDKVKHGNCSYGKQCAFCHQ